MIQARIEVRPRAARAGAGRQIPRILLRRSLLRLRTRGGRLTRASRRAEALMIALQHRHKAAEGRLEMRDGA